MTGVLIASALALLAACARDCTPAVRDGWVRMPAMAMPMLAGFGRIENGCSAPLTIVSARSPAFADVTLHETRIVGGISQMRPVPELVIAPGSAAELQPGGLHLMLMQPSHALATGSTVAIEFALKDGGVLRGEFALRNPGE